MNQKEIWKEVCGYEGLYHVSNLGRVKSTVCKKYHILKPTLSCNGYHQVSLYVNGCSKTFFIHRLLMLSFIPNPENKPHVNHIDSNTINNNLDNLEWCTRSENIQHGYDFGNMKAPMRGKFGKKHNRSKAIVQLTSGGAYVNTFGSAYEAQRKTGISRSGISSACAGRQKTSGGFMWKIA